MGSEPGLEAFREEIEQLKRMALDPNVSEEKLRRAAAKLKSKLKPLGYTVVVRRTPEWFSGPRFQVIVRRLSPSSESSVGEFNL